LKRCVSIILTWLFVFIFISIWLCWFFWCDKWCGLWIFDLINWITLNLWWLGGEVTRPAKFDTITNVEGAEFTTLYNSDCTWPSQGFDRYGGVCFVSFSDSILLGITVDSD
jgi:hypothetical protein